MLLLFLLVVVLCSWIFKTTYDYLHKWDQQSGESGDVMPVELVSEVRNYVAGTFELFGFSSLSGNTHGDAARSSSEEDLSQVLLEFRAAVRGLALDSDTVDRGQLLSLCDSLRDDVLPTLLDDSITADLASAQVT